MPFSIYRCNIECRVKEFLWDQYWYNLHVGCPFVLFSNPACACNNWGKLHTNTKMENRVWVILRRMHNSNVPMRIQVRLYRVCPYLLSSICFIQGFHCMTLPWNSTSFGIVRGLVSASSLWKHIPSITMWRPCTYKWDQHNGVRYR
jgi:hypothetical protein